MHLIYKNNCRICNNPILKSAFNLGDHFLHGSFVNPTKNIYPPIRKIPVELVRCDPAYNDGCGLLQLKHTVDPSILYANYGYRSSTNRTMKVWLNYIVDSVMELKPKLKSVQDIGANDMFTLSLFPENVKRVGVDGCDIINKVDAGGIDVVNALYPVESRFLSVYYKNKFDVILSIACLYDIELINKFVESIAYELKRDGIWVFEVAYLPTILRNINYSHFVHEHLLTFSIATIEKLLKKHDLRLFRANISETNGGSILCYACHDSCDKFDNKKNQQNLQEIRLAEFDIELDTDKPYIEFRDKINDHRQDLHNLVTKLVKSGKTIHLLSASTKGNLILQYAKIDNKLIKYASERSPEKVGCRTLGTDIKIISEEESRKMNPDYYLCLISHFREEVIKREADFIKNGGKFIFPFPFPKIIEKDNIIKY